MIVPFSTDIFAVYITRLINADGAKRLLITSSGKWAVCSGSIKASDTSLESAAQREILEETGLYVPEDIYLLHRRNPFSLTTFTILLGICIHVPLHSTISGVRRSHYHVLNI